MKNLTALFIIVLLITTSLLAQIPLNNALSLDGNADYMQVPNDSSLNSFQEMTIEVWIKPTLFDGVSRRVIIDKEIPDGSGNKHSYMMRIDTYAGHSHNIEIFYHLNGQENSNIFSSTYELGLNEWTHLALVYGPDNWMRLYINGVQDASKQTDGSALAYSEDPMYVGNNGTGTSYGFAGYMDELRIWNRVRSREQIQQTMYESLSEEVYTEADSGLVGYWKFDTMQDLGINSDGADDLFDYSIHQNHGDLGGDAYLADAITMATGLKRDSLSLVVLYDSTKGENWTNKWELKEAVSTWYGVKIANDRVTSISLFNNELDGTLPEAIGNLDSLNYFRLGLDNIGGAFPDTIWSLANLETISLYNTQLEGTISTRIGNLKKLKHLNLSIGKFSGTIPAEIGQCTQLSYFRIGNNQLSGSLPEEMANLTELTDIWLANNQLSGPFPEHILSLSNLQSINLGGNYFNGPIPPEIGNLSELVWVYLESNDFSGEIPKELGNLKKAVFLQLQSNKLNGTVPKELGRMESLEYLRLYNNKLEGALPDSIANLTNLRLIRIDKNKFNYLPDFSALSQLKKIEVQNNNLSFSDLEKQLSNSALTTFNYAPQDSIGQGQSILFKIGDTLEFSVNPGGNYTTYQWQKDGLAIAGAIDSQLVFYNIQAEDAGKYFCVMSNDSLPDLILYSRVITLAADSTTAIFTDNLQIPETTRLLDNYPNPFNPTTVISYQVGAIRKSPVHPVHVELTVYSVLGQKVRTLVNRRQEAGLHSITFNADGLASGVYIYRLSTSSGFVQTKKMILLR